jgi:pyruvate dehydrogenase E2 component (dihydrolipoamide acetyltransferase)
MRSRQEIPEVTVWLDVDASGLLSARDRLAQQTPGSKNIVLGLIASLCVRALVSYPALNGKYDLETGAVVQNKTVNLGVAVQSDRGLVVPVLHDADGVDARELCARVSEIVTRARQGTLRASHLNGGTFTLNNYGGLGVDGSTPIINYPESAILGVGRIMRRPWVVGDEVVVRPIVTVSMAYDHRVSDGAYAAAFLRLVCEGFESAPRALDD